MIPEERFISEIEAIKKGLFNFARNSLYNGAEAEDVFSDAVVSAWAERIKFQEGTNFRAWLYRILLNKIYAANRRHALDAKVVQNHDNQESVSARLDELPDMEVLMENPSAILDRCSDDLRRALTTLNESEREAFLLLSLCNLSYAEIATVTGAPQGTVVTRLTRARTKLRTSLKSMAPSAAVRIKAK